MAPKTEADDAELDVKSEGKDSPKGSDQSAKVTSKSAAKRRTKTGCLTCRRRRIKCGEEKPFCKNCIKSKRECAGYVQPLVYKQQAGLAGREASSRSSISDGDFQFNEGYGAYTPATPYASFNPFLSAQGQFGHAYGLHHPITSTTYGTHADAFEAYRRHSFQDHNTNLLGFGAPSQAFGVGQEPSWPDRPFPPSISENGGHPRGQSGLSSTMMTSPGAFSESYAGVSSNHSPFDANPLHETPRRYSVHGFVHATSLGPQFPTLGAPRDLHYLDEDIDDADDTEMDDMEEEMEQSLNLHERYAQRGHHPGHRTRRRYDGTVKIPNQLPPKSPLLDERNEQVFAHFVNVLAPCMSTFERPSLDPWAAPPRTVWSYILPSAAMSNPALAHAMLATAGLHIAKLQQSTDSVSLKHFTYAARRVGKLLSLPHRRHDVTTLATVLLLGYYEVLNSDHSRWSLHLAGATKLVTEHDMASLTYRARCTRNRTSQLLRSHPNPQALTEQDHIRLGIAPTLLRDVEWDVDTKLITSLTGVSPLSDTCGEAATAAVDFRPMTDAEVTVYRTKMDLWWWFCKQDMFQSMVSGERLLMPFRERMHCPPRGRIGVADQYFATFDHLVLLLSRLTDFGGKDRHRKQRVIASSGGQWIPPTWLFTRPPAKPAPEPSYRAPSDGTRRENANSQLPSTVADDPAPARPRAPSANEGRTRQSRPGQAENPRSEGPPMFGMMPPPPMPPKMHSSFHAMDRSLRQGTTATSNDGNSPRHSNLDEETADARREHASISEAFDVFHASLGQEMQPLPYEGAQLSSPFGPKIQYAGPEIACMWAHYHIGRILLHRLHPDMPPAAMVAAGVTAHLTKTEAQIVGQICAGLLASIPAAGSAQEALSPRHAASLMEISFAILFAGVQYTEMSQRGWVISKLHDIAQMTGWSTSAAVAAACEISWERMGQAGKGPPYVRSLDRNNKDERVNGHLRRLAPMLSASITDAAGDHNAQILGHDRGLISKSTSSRVHWAMGLLSVEEDVKNMNIGQD